MSEKERSIRGPRAVQGVLRVPQLRSGEAYVRRDGGVQPADPPLRAKQTSARMHAR